jgi:hypothetical protein
MNTSNSIFQQMSLTLWGSYKPFIAQPECRFDTHASGYGSVAF